MLDEDPRKKNRQLRGSLEPIEGKCGAKIRRTDPQKYCTQDPMPNGRCYHHGGASNPAGPTNPAYKHGRYSKDLPAGPVRDRILAALDDPEILSISQNVALVNARLWMLLERLTSGESTGHWDRLVKVWTTFQGANQQIQAAIREQQDEHGKPSELQSLAKLNRIDAKISSARKQASESLNAIGKLISDGAANQEQWRELLEIGKHEAELKRAESARVAELGQVMTAQQTITLFTALSSAIAKHVLDQKVKQDIAMELARLMNSPGVPHATRHQLGFAGPRSTAD